MPKLLCYIGLCKASLPRTTPINNTIVFPKLISLNPANSVNHDKIQKLYDYQGEYLSTDRYIPINSNRKYIFFTISR